MHDRSWSYVKVDGKWLVRPSGAGRVGYATSHLHTFFPSLRLLLLYAICDEIAPLIANHLNDSYYWLICGRIVR